MDTFVKENIKSFLKNPGTKCPRNLTHYEKTKSKKDRNKGRRRKPVKGTENIFSKIIEDKLKEMPLKVREAYRAPQVLDQKRHSPQHIIVKTTNRTKKSHMKSYNEKTEM